MKVVERVGSVAESSVDVDDDKEAVDALDKEPVDEAVLTRRLLMM